jgi:hypothetical protein
MFGKLILSSAALALVASAAIAQAPPVEMKAAAEAANKH